MLKKAIKYGGIAGVVLGAVFMASFFFISGEEPNYTLGETVGYVAITLSLIVVFFGIRSYRDDDLGGVISFGKALKMGVLTAAFVAATFAIIDGAYVTLVNPDFFSEYMEWEIEKMQADGASQTDIEAYREQYAAFQGPFGFLINGAVMFLTVLLIGFVISAISALVLRTPDPVGDGTPG